MLRYRALVCVWGGEGEREHTHKCLETYVRSVELMFRDIGLVRRDRAEIGLVER